MNIAELLIPALRWDPNHGYDKQQALIDRGLELGVGGFILFDGRSEEVGSLTRELTARSKIPLLVGADLERGVEQQFEGATGLPPLAALGALGDTAAVQRAAALTARESRDLGVNWVFAPVLDLDIEPDNPIVGTRAFGGDPEPVARLGAAWIDACQAERVLACGKHFPGHGRTTTDSHAELPVVTASKDALEREDLLPFKYAVLAGVASIMTAHVAFPELDPRGGPATLSAPILRGLLRERLGYDELIVTDALIMAGVLQEQSEARASSRALAAGCDLLLYPDDLEAVVRALEDALEHGDLERDEVERSIARRRKWAEWAAQPAGPAAVGNEGEWARSLAGRVITEVQGRVPEIAGSVAVTIVDDDVGGPYPPPSREPFITRLRESGLQVSVGDSEAEPRGGTRVVGLFGDIRAWKGRPGYSGQALDQLRRAVAAARDRSDQVVVVQFSHPRLARGLGVDVPIVTAWGGDPVMQRAAADWVVDRSPLSSRHRPATGRR